MKKNIARTVCFALSLATVVTAMVGCKSNSKTTATGSGGAPVTIHIMDRVNAQVSFDNNNWVKAVDKAANVNLVFDAPPINNYDDRLQITMASGDLPDIIYNWHQGDANYQKWAADGLLADITSKIKSYPNLTKNLTSAMWDDVKTNGGKIYSVPKANMENHYGLIINQTWLDKLNLKAPTTLDELESVCKAFTTQDPDGDGKADTYGLSYVFNTGSVSQGFEAIMSAFGLTNNNGSPCIGIKDTDGKYKILEKMSGYIPYLTYMRKLTYTDKVVDPEFFTNKMYADTDKLAQNKVGIVNNHQNSVMSGISTLSNYDKIFHYYAPPKNSKGQATTYIYLPVWGQWMISKNCKNIDAVLKFLDWGNSEEGFTLMNIGEKGVDYNSFDLKTHAIDRTDAQTNKLATECSSYTAVSYALNGQTAIIPNCNTADRLQEFNDQYNAMIKAVKEVDVPAITAVNCPKLANFATTNPDDVKTRDQYVIKYITGEITLDQFQNYLNNTYFPKVADAEKEYVNYMNSLK